MMTLPSFDFLAPESTKDAVSLIDHYKDRAKILAGGTDLIPSMKNKLFEPEVVISINNIPELKKIHFDTELGLTLGGLVSLTDVGHHPLVTENYPVLAEAAKKIATPLLQNKGTIGGNILLDTRCYYYNQSHFWRKAVNNCMKKDGDICRVAPGGHRCYAISSCDTVPVLYALDAVITLVSAQGERKIPLREFYQNDGMAFNKLLPNEILTQVQIPKLPSGFRGAYMKLRRRQAIDYPMLGVMVGLILDDNEVCIDAKIILGAVFPCPWEVTEAQNVLIGKKITENEIEEASEIAYNTAKPMDLTNFRPAYRKRMVKVFTRRILQNLSQQSEYTEEVLA
ncbi:FAD binding domain-containing protein [bacterium]|nr:FAD binding domain-containing protein [bacterium]